ncbi:glycosyltransferase [Desulfosarcina sp. OttesenSCG-928-A07]|nr:glycosyltransferase [Desulfosarcina sp. OttesenSCG-928-G17]MDL2329296.1 glycosyltransferase [Desulfosarcina sp. OttesenSCG-928-A07]
MNIDIIYVNYNSTADLTQSIHSIPALKKATHRLHITVVDNASADPPFWLTAFFPDVKFIFNRKNIGFGAAINQALRHTNSPYVILLNPDSLVSDGFFDECSDFLEKNPGVGIMGPMIVDEDGSLQGSARAFPTPMTTFFGRNSFLTRLFPKNSISRANILTWKNKKNQPMEVDWVSGACMVARRSAIEGVGGFDSRFFLYWEDADLCHRIRQKAWKVVYYPKPKVTHFGARSSRTRPFFSSYQFHKSGFLLFAKYATWPSVLLFPLAATALMARFFSMGLISRIMMMVKDPKRPVKKDKFQKRRADDRKTFPLPKKDPRKRVLYVISRLNIGGPAVHVNTLIRYLDADTYEVRLVAGRISPNEGDMRYIFTPPEQAKIFYIPELQREISIFKDAVSLFRLISVIRAFNPQIVDSHTSKAGTLSRMAAFFCNVFRKQKIVTVHTFHGNVLDGYFNKFKSILFLRIERMLAKVTDRIIVLSESQKKDLAEHYQVADPDKIKVVNLGFDLLPFKTSGEKKGIFRKKIGVGPDTRLIGIVGRLVPIKNHYLFFNAAKQVLERHGHPNLKFVVVGDGELRGDLENYVADQHLSDAVVFCGWEKDVSLVYPDLDIVALTSLNEGTPVSIIEAMAADVPVISTDVGGIRDLLGKIHKDDFGAMGFSVCERGVLCIKNNPSAFANGLSYLLRNPDAQKIAGAREFVLNNYAAAILVKRMGNTYEALLSSHPAQTR